MMICILCHCLLEACHLLLDFLLYKGLQLRDNRVSQRDFGLSSFALLKIFFLMRMLLQAIKDKRIVCGGLNENSDPHRLLHLKTWSLLG